MEIQKSEDSIPMYSDIFLDSGIYTTGNIIEYKFTFSQTENELTITAKRSGAKEGWVIDETGHFQIAEYI